MAKENNFAIDSYNEQVKKADSSVDTNVGSIDLNDYISDEITPIDAEYVVSESKDRDVSLENLKSTAKATATTVEASMSKEEQTKYNLEKLKAQAHANNATTIKEEKAAEDAEKGIGAIWETLDLLTRPIYALEGFTSGIFAYTDDKFDAADAAEKNDIPVVSSFYNVLRDPAAALDRAKQGFVMGATGAEDEEGHRLITDAGVVASIIQGDTDVKEWGIPAKITATVLPMVAFGYLDPVYRGFQLAGKSKYAVSTGIRKMQGFSKGIGKADIKNTEEGVALINSLSDNIFKENGFYNNAMFDELFNAVYDMGLTPADMFYTDTYSGEVFIDQKVATNAMKKASQKYKADVSAMTTNASTILTNNRDTILKLISDAVRDGNIEVLADIGAFKVIAKDYDITAEALGLKGKLPEGMEVNEALADNFWIKDNLTSKKDKNALATYFRRIWDESEMQVIDQIQKGIENPHNEFKSKLVTSAMTEFMDFAEKGASISAFEWIKHMTNDEPVIYLIDQARLMSLFPHMVKTGAFGDGSPLFMRVAEIFEELNLEKDEIDKAVERIHSELGDFKLATQNIEMTNILNEIGISPEDLLISLSDKGIRDVEYENAVDMIEKLGQVDVADALSDMEFSIESILSKELGKSDLPFKNVDELKGAIAEALNSGNVKWDEKGALKEVIYNKKLTPARAKNIGNSIDLKEFSHANIKSKVNEAVESKLKDNPIYKGLDDRSKERLTDLVMLEQVNKGNVTWEDYILNKVELNSSELVDKLETIRDVSRFELEETAESTKALLEKTKNRIRYELLDAYDQAGMSTDTLNAIVDIYYPVWLSKAMIKKGENGVSLVDSGKLADITSIIENPISQFAHKSEELEKIILPIIEEVDKGIKSGEIDPNLFTQGKGANTIKGRAAKISDITRRIVDTKKVEASAGKQLPDFSNRVSLVNEEITEYAKDLDSVIGIETGISQGVIENEIRESASKVVDGIWSEKKANEKLISNIKKLAEDKFNATDLDVSMSAIDIEDKLNIIRDQLEGIQDVDIMELIAPSDFLEDYEYTGTPEGFAELIDNEAGTEINSKVLKMLIEQDVDRTDIDEIEIFFDEYRDEIAAIEPEDGFGNNTDTLETRNNLIKQQAKLEKQLLDIETRSELDKKLEDWANSAIAKSANLNLTLYLEPEEVTRLKETVKNVISLNTKFGKETAKAEEKRIWDNFASKGVKTGNGGIYFSARGSEKMEQLQEAFRIFEQEIAINKQSNVENLTSKKLKIGNFTTSTEDVETTIAKMLGSSRKEGSKDAVSELNKARKESINKIRGRGADENQITSFENLADKAEKLITEVESKFKKYGWMSPFDGSKVITDDIIELIKDAGDLPNLDIDKVSIGNKNKKIQNVEELVTTKGELLDPWLQETILNADEPFHSIDYLTGTTHDRAIGAYQSRINMLALLHRNNLQHVSKKLPTFYSGALEKIEKLKVTENFTEEASAIIREEFMKMLNDNPTIMRRSKLDEDTLYHVFGQPVIDWAKLEDGTLNKDDLTNIIKKAQSRKRADKSYTNSMLPLNDAAIERAEINKGATSENLVYGGNQVSTKEDVSNKIRELQKREDDIIRATSEAELAKFSMDTLFTGALHIRDSLNRSTDVLNKIINNERTPEVLEAIKELESTGVKDATFINQPIKDIKNSVVKSQRTFVKTYSSSIKESMENLNSVMADLKANPLSSDEHELLSQEFQKIQDKVAAFKKSTNPKNRFIRSSEILEDISNMYVNIEAAIEHAGGFENEMFGATQKEEFTNKVKQAAADKITAIDTAHAIAQKETILKSHSNLMKSIAKKAKTGTFGSVDSKDSLDVIEQVRNLNEGLLRVFIDTMDTNLNTRARLEVPAITDFELKNLEQTKNNRLKTVVELQATVDKLAKDVEKFNRSPFDENGLITPTAMANAKGNRAAFKTFNLYNARKTQLEWLKNEVERIESTLKIQASSASHVDEIVSIIEILTRDTNIYGLSQGASLSDVRNVITGKIDRRRVKSGYVPLTTSEMNKNIALNQSELSLPNMIEQTLEFWRNSKSFQEKATKGFQEKNDVDLKLPKKIQKDFEKAVMDDIRPKLPKAITKSIGIQTDKDGKFIGQGIKNTYFTGLKKELTEAEIEKLAETQDRVNKLELQAEAIKTEIAKIKAASTGDSPSELKAKLSEHNSKLPKIESEIKKLKQELKAGETAEFYGEFDNVESAAGIFKFDAVLNSLGKQFEQFIAANPTLKWNNITSEFMKLLEEGGVEINAYTGELRIDKDVADRVGLITEENALSEIQKQQQIFARSLAEDYAGKTGVIANSEIYANRGVTAGTPGSVITYYAIEALKAAKLPEGETARRLENIRGLVATATKGNYRTANATEDIIKQLSPAEIAYYKNAGKRVFENSDKVEVAQNPDFIARTVSRSSKNATNVEYQQFKNTVEKWRESGDYADLNKLFAPEFAENTRVTKWAENKNKKTSPFEMAKNEAFLSAKKKYGSGKMEEEEFNNFLEYLFTETEQNYIAQTGGLTKAQTKSMWSAITGQQAERRAMSAQQYNEAMKLIDKRFPGNSVAKVALKNLPESVALEAIEKFKEFDDMVVRAAATIKKSERFVPGSQERKIMEKAGLLRRYNSHLAKREEVAKKIAKADQLQAALFGDGSIKLDGAVAALNQTRTEISSEINRLEKSIEANKEYRNKKLNDQRHTQAELDFANWGVGKSKSIIKEVKKAITAIENSKVDLHTLTEKVKPAVETGEFSKRFARTFNSLTSKTSELGVFTRLDAMGDNFRVAMKENVEAFKSGKDLKQLDSFKLLSEHINETLGKDVSDKFADAVAEKLIKEFSDANITFEGTSAELIPTDIRENIKNSTGDRFLLDPNNREELLDDANIVAGYVKDFNILVNSLFDYMQYEEAYVGASETVHTYQKRVKDKITSAVNKSDSVMTKAEQKAQIAEKELQPLLAKIDADIKKVESKIQKDINGLTTKMEQLNLKFGNGIESLDTPADMQKLITDLEIYEKGLAAEIKGANNLIVHAASELSIQKQNLKEILEKIDKANERIAKVSEQTDSKFAGLKGRNARRQKEIAKLNTLGRGDMALSAEAISKLVNAIPASSEGRITKDVAKAMGREVRSSDINLQFLRVLGERLDDPEVIDLLKELGFYEGMFNIQEVSEDVRNPFITGTTMGLNKSKAEQKGTAANKLKETLESLKSGVKPGSKKAPAKLANPEMHNPVIMERMARAYQTAYDLALGNSSLMSNEASEMSNMISTTITELKNKMIKRAGRGVVSQQDLDNMLKSYAGFSEEFSAKFLDDKNYISHNAANRNLGLDGMEKIRSKYHLEKRAESNETATEKLLSELYKSTNYRQAVARRQRNTGSSIYSRKYVGTKKQVNQAGLNTLSNENFGIAGMLDPQDPAVQFLSTDPFASTTAMVRDIGKSGSTARAIMQLFTTGAIKNPENVPRIGFSSYESVPVDNLIAKIDEFSTTDIIFSKRTVDKENIVKELKKKGVDGVDLPKDLKSIRARLASSTRALIEREIGEDIRKDNAMVAIPKELANVLGLSANVDVANKMTKVLQLMNEWMSWWKKMTLATPGFNLKNITGNLTMEMIYSPGSTYYTAANGTKIMGALNEAVDIVPRIVKQITEDVAKETSAIKSMVERGVKPKSGSKPYHYKLQNGDLVDIRSNMNLAVRDYLKVNEGKFQTMGVKGLKGVARKNLSPVDVLEILDRTIDQINVHPQVLSNIMDGNVNISAAMSPQQAQQLHAGALDMMQALKTDKTYAQFLTEVSGRQGVGKDTVEQFGEVMNYLLEMNLSASRDSTAILKLGQYEYINDWLIDIFEKFEEVTGGKFETIDDLKGFRKEFQTSTGSWSTHGRNKTARKYNRNTFYDKLESLTDSQRAAWTDLQGKMMYSRYNFGDLRTMVKEMYFDISDTKSLANQTMSTIFPFWGFMRQSIVNTLKRWNNFDFTGEYQIFKIVDGMRKSQQISRNELTQWSREEQYLPFKTANGDIVSLKWGNPINTLTKYLTPDQTILNELASSANPVIKFLVSEASGRTDLFFGGKYDSLQEEVIETFSPSQVRNIKKSLSDLEEGRTPDTDGIDVRHGTAALVAMFPGIFKQEDSVESKIAAYTSAMGMYQTALNRAKMENGYLVGSDIIFPSIPNYTPHYWDIYSPELDPYGTQTFTDWNVFEPETKTIDLFGDLPEYY